MDLYSFAEFDEDAVKRVREIDEKRRKESNGKTKEKGRKTRLMFEQMLRGLYLNTVNPNV
jgi:hypothetical protein